MCTQNLYQIVALHPGVAKRDGGGGLVVVQQPRDGIQSGVGLDFEKPLFNGMGVMGGVDFHHLRLTHEAGRQCGNGIGIGRRKQQGLFLLWK